MASYKVSIDRSALVRVGLIFAGVVAISASSFARGPSGEKFSISEMGAVEARFGYFPVPIKLTDEKPASIVKEPVYAAKPKYAIVHLGNGPKNATVMAFDEPATGDWKVYIDKNQDGDLTNDGDGAWNKKTSQTGRDLYGVMYVTLHASYGTPKEETASTDYTIGLYRFSNAGPFMYRASSRVGNVMIDGKSHKAVVVENDADAVYDKPVLSVADAGKTRPVWMQIDTNDDGKFASGILDVRAPFKMGDKTYEVKLSPDGSIVSFEPTNKVALELTPKREPTPELLKAGVKAPSFVAEKWGGGNLSLADYKGKVVILDFWATWCGPCQKSMPHIESVSKKVKGQDVVVIGVCVWDDKSAYSDWIPKNKDKYTFQFAFDPAGQSTKDSIASKLFKVSGIPTTYIIDKDGKVADAIVGYDDGDTRVEDALKKVGVKL